MMGEKGFAMRIDFNPLKGTRVQLPAGVTFVVTNCLVESHKLLTADKMYNKRVVECRLASCLLAKLLGVEAWRTATPLLSLCGALKLTREQLHARADELMGADPYTVESIQAALGLESLDELVADIKMATGVFKNNADFHLKKCALHVFGEASRVFDFQAVCDRLAATAAAKADAGASASASASASATEASAKAVQEIGALMNGSHQSCDALFDCSCDALNKLQQTCMCVSHILFALPRVVFYLLLAVCC